MIRFENPSWAFWTDAFYAVLGEEYAGDWVGLNVTLEGMVTGLAPGGGKVSSRIDTNAGAVYKPN